MYLIGLELDKYAKLAGQQALRICQAPPTQHRDYKCLIPCLAFFQEFWGSNLGPRACKVSKHFTVSLASAPFLPEHTSGLCFLVTVVLNVSLADQIFLGRQKTKKQPLNITSFWPNNALPG